MTNRHLPKTCSGAVQLKVGRPFVCLNSHVSKTHAATLDKYYTRLDVAQACYERHRTTEAEKFFDVDWDFAVPRQGYQDYTFKAFHKDECDRKKQWIFFKAHSEDALERLLALDFQKLSLLNTGIPGFGKADVVEAYLRFLR